jgi:ABC-type ATPase with predicted acetyltransferase domain
MPGPLKSKITDQNEALQLINERNEILFVDVKGHIDKNYLNEVVNFPPIFMNVDITTNKETIGESMYEYMISNGMKLDKKERKLTQLTDTHNT